MGCDVGCPYIGRAFDDNWGLQDPTGQSDEVFIEVIKEIENRISQLYCGFSLYDIAVSVVAFLDFGMGF